MQELIDYYKVRMQLKPKATQYKELFDGIDVWMVDFFQRLELNEIVELANAANYLDMPRLIDACLAVLALQ